MKKLFLSFAVIASLSMISCGNKAENTATEENVEVAEEVVEEAPADSTAAPVDTTANNDSTKVAE